MDEYEETTPTCEQHERSGDVDDLIFYHDPEWYISER